MMLNKSPEKTRMPEQLPEARNKNFSEVALGYTAQMAVEEASRCLGCKNPLCVTGCPVNVRIPDFIALIRDGKFSEACSVIRSTNSLPAICGRVCPQEKQCEGKCIRGKNGDPVAIGNLERFCADFALSSEKDTEEIPEKNGRKVAVIGSGPGGLSCAGSLVRLGYDVTVFEALHKSGGVLCYGIPEFRLPKALVEKEIRILEKLGVKIERNIIIGKTLSVEELFSDLGFEAVYIGTGAGLPNFMGIPGENLGGVYSANEFLTRINLMRAYDFPNADTPVKIGKRAAIIGGGNVAMDAARSAKRLGAGETYIVYRRSEEEMPARAEEIRHAKEEGITVLDFTSPTEITGDEKGFVSGLRCIKTAPGKADSSGRRKAVPVEGSEFVLPADTVIIAIGNSPNPLILSSVKGLSSNERGGILADEDGRTSLEGVFAGGDAVTGAATVILAMGSGKKSAKAIDEYLKNK